MIDIDTFITDGYVKIEQPQLRNAADEACAMLWRQLGISPGNRGGWTAPVLWAADMTGAGPFGELVRSAALAAALDAVCGAGGWNPRGALGNIPVRFPVSPAADDRGWHIDLNTTAADGSWWVSARPHTVTLLTLLSEVGPDDAPTRIRPGSHVDAAGVLTEEMMDAVTAGALADRASATRPVVHATGDPGDMYLVHPFTVHAADEHRGDTPRFMAQCPVLLAEALSPASATPLAHVFAR